MDSLTQITLGAAVGEVVLGKRVGNKAMLWGAVAGTIPDLDILANFVTDEISALAYHRAITHSLTFSIVVPVALGLLIHRLYQGREGPLKQSFFGTWLATFAFVFALLLGGSYLMPLDIANVPAISLIVTAVILAIPLLSLGSRALFKRPPLTDNPSWWAWTQLFFWAIITHPLLDACTTYGTQLFEPFSDLRIAWNVVSVADPLYTVPFLVCLIIASRLPQASTQRAKANWLGIGISSAYLLLCTAFLQHAERVMDDTLQQEGIVAQRSMVSPTIFNSLLWQGTAETDSLYFAGQYSLLDTDRNFKLTPVAKQHELLSPHWEDPHVRTLRWFSDGYFQVVKRPEGGLRYNDLRFGGITMPGKEDPEYVFYFLLDKNENGLLEARQSNKVPDQAASEIFALLWQRIKGI